MYNITHYTYNIQTHRYIVLMLQKPTCCCMESSWGKGILLKSESESLPLLELSG